ncbi:MAG: hypothetical protein HY809_00455, partial [Nitrospirae bacterium]|nr:hypothetical protein [Nitrospirota bacterium]
MKIFFNKFFTFFLLLIMGLGGYGDALGNDYHVKNSRHTGSRNTYKILFRPDSDVSNRSASSDNAFTFLSQKNRDFGLPRGLSNLKLAKVRESLLGRHYHFQQYINGIPVESAEIIVSAGNDGNILRVFNNTYPVKTNPLELKKKIIKEDALNKAWRDLKVHGKLLSMPESEAFYLPEASGVRLIYRTRISVTARA